MSKKKVAAGVALALALAAVALPFEVWRQPEVPFHQNHDGEGWPLILRRSSGPFEVGEILIYRDGDGHFMGEVTRVLKEGYDLVCPNYPPYALYNTVAEEGVVGCVVARLYHVAPPLKVSER